MAQDRSYDFFKFYNGEEQNPFAGKDGDKTRLWECERIFALAGADKGVVTEYKNYVKNLLDDDVQEGFKAILFNRYMSGEFSVEDALDDFIKYYKKYYG